MLEDVQLDEFKDLTDTDLIRLFKNGSQAAFQQLAVRYMFVIRSKFADLYDKGIETDDLMQEGFLALHSAVKTYHENANTSFRTYAGTCIRNRLVSAVRSVNSKKNQFNVAASSLESAENIPVSSENEPENALIIKEDFSRLMKYIETNLSKTEQQVLLLYLDGKSYDEISQTLEISKKSCDNAMQRVRQKLKIRN